MLGRVCSPSVLRVATAFRATSEEATFVGAEIHLLICKDCKAIRHATSTMPKSDDDRSERAQSGCGSDVSIILKRVGGRKG